jgi:glycosyltransferase involved in cell wall biosynthesis
MARTLYISYFGLREPLVQTQVLPYLREIMRRDGGDGLREPITVSLLTFEPQFRQAWTPDELKKQKEDLAAEGIEWHAAGYHKWPSVPATFFDILNGTRVILRLMRRQKFEVLHARVHIPMLMAAIARKLSRQRPKLLFDIRGFFPEEYTDAGRWPEGGWLYRSAKRIERWLLKQSDGFVVLTEKAREILFPESAANGFDKFGRPVEVIPCCVDLKRFETDKETVNELRRRLGIKDRPVLAYVGSFGGWYLTDEMFDLFTAAKGRDPRTFILILTQREKERIANELRKRGFGDADFVVESVPPQEISKYLSAADISVSFIKACYSKLSSSPTKIAEYLACGLPVIINDGVGDLNALITANGVGTVISDFSKASYISGLQELLSLNDIADKCRDTARREFDLESVGGVRYRRLYSRLVGKQDEQNGQISQ